MTMVGDMFKTALKARVEALCADLAALVADDPALTAPSAPAAEVEGERAGSGAWWPAGLPTPDSTGSQNHTRYAWFAASRRLAIERAGRVTLYDTLDHRIGGVAQQQAGTSTLSFTSQHGVVDPVRLPIVDGARGERRASRDAPAAISVIERLAELHARGILSEADSRLRRLSCSAGSEPGTPC